MNFSQVSGDGRLKKKKYPQDPWYILFYLFIFYVDHFKVFIEFIIIVLSLMTFFFLEEKFYGCQTCGILAPRPRIKPAHPARGGAVLTTGPPGKSPRVDFFNLGGT